MLQSDQKLALDLEVEVELKTVSDVSQVVLGSSKY